MTRIRVSSPKQETETLREQLADLEHQQWAHWTRYMLDNLTPENIERWKGQCDTSYSELTEKEKDSDREWADKSLAVMASIPEIEEALDVIAVRDALGD